MPQEHKISQALLAFSEPLWKSDPEDPPSTEDFTRALHVASLIWNAVALDVLLESSECVDYLHQAAQRDPAFTGIIEMLIERKQEQFGQDLRVIFNFNVVAQDGQWRVDAQAMSLKPRPPGAKPSPAERAALQDKVRQMFSQLNLRDP